MEKKINAVILFEIVSDGNGQTINFSASGLSDYEIVGILKTYMEQVVQRGVNNINKYNSPKNKKQ